jgi:hypothetical protein
MRFFFSETESYNCSMTTVQEIKAAIEKLSLSERAEVARFVHGWADDAWDEQIKRDFDGGKFDRIMKEIDADLEAGRLEDGP